MLGVPPHCRRRKSRIFWQRHCDIAVVARCVLPTHCASGKDLQHGPWLLQSLNFARWAAAIYSFNFKSSAFKKKVYLLHTTIFKKKTCILKQPTAESDISKKQVKDLMKISRFVASLSILTLQKCLFWEPGPLLYRFQPLHWRVQGSLGFVDFPKYCNISNILKQYPMTEFSGLIIVKKSLTDFSPNLVLVSYRLESCRNSPYAPSNSKVHRGGVPVTGKMKPLKYILGIRQLISNTSNIYQFFAGCIFNFRRFYNNLYVENTWASSAKLGGRA